MISMMFWVYGRFILLISSDVVSSFVLVLEVEMSDLSMDDECKPLELNAVRIWSSSIFIYSLLNMSVCAPSSNVVTMLCLAL